MLADIAGFRRENEDLISFAAAERADLLRDLLMRGAGRQRLFHIHHVPHFRHGRKEQRLLIRVNLRRALLQSADRWRTGPGASVSRTLLTTDSAGAVTHRDPCCIDDPIFENGVFRDKCFQPFDIHDHFPASACVAWEARYFAMAAFRPFVK